MNVIFDFIEKFFSRYGFILFVAIIAGIISQISQKRQKKVPKKLMKEPYGYDPQTDEPLNLMFSGINNTSACLLYAFGICFILGGMILVYIISAAVDFAYTGIWLYIAFVLLLICIAICFIPARALSCKRVYYNSKLIFTEKFSGSFDVFSWQEVANIEPVRDGFLLRDARGKVLLRTTRNFTNYNAFKKLAEQYCPASSDYI